MKCAYCKVVIVLIVNDLFPEGRWFATEHQGMRHPGNCPKLWGYTPHAPCKQCE